MLQLQRILFTLCAGYCGTLACHYMPSVGQILEFRTKPMAEALAIFQAPEAQQFPDLDLAKVPMATPLTPAPLVATPVATSLASTTTPATTTVTANTTCGETTITRSTEPATTAPVATGLFTEMDTWFKAYMDYRTITDTASTQYALQQQAWTDAQGLRRIGEDYLVAMGTGWLTEGCGDRFQVTLESGAEFTVMVGDIKADAHTDPTRRYRSCGGGANVLEFIVDADLLSAQARQAGTVSVYDGLAGNIVALVPLGGE